MSKLQFLGLFPMRWSPFLPVPQLCKGIQCLSFKPSSQLCIILLIFPAILSPVLVGGAAWIESQEGPPPRLCARSFSPAVQNQPHPVLFLAGEDGFSKLRVLLLARLKCRFLSISSNSFHFTLVNTLLGKLFSVQLGKSLCTYIILTVYIRTVGSLYFPRRI